MGLFPAVKKLYHFEIPMGYCYSPLDGLIKKFVKKEQNVVQALFGRVLQIVHNVKYV